MPDNTTPPSISEAERLRRWRLLLGGNNADATGCRLEREDAAMDRALAALYDSERRGGLGSSSPNVARWLGDIREYFPSSVVRILQQDALKRLNLHGMLLEAETLAAIEPDVHLVAAIVSLANVIPAQTRDTARRVVRRVVDDMIRRLDLPIRQAISSSLDRSARTQRPRTSEIDWHRTIRTNLKHYQSEHGTIIPERLVGYARHRRASLRDVILCVDQSGSMASSVVYASIYAAVMASIASVTTRLVLFDTAVADMTDLLSDPVDLLFGTQLGGGTDINQALAYCQSKIDRPADTILILISDLYEGGNRETMMHRVADIVGSGVSMIALLALSDDGAPSYDHGVAEAYASLGVPAFAATPDIFPELMSAAITRSDITAWAAKQGRVTSRSRQH